MVKSGDESIPLEPGKVEFRFRMNSVGRDSIPLQELKMRLRNIGFACKTINCPGMHFKIEAPEKPMTRPWIPFEGEAAEWLEKLVETLEAISRINDIELQ
jgi:hypothetical protein